MEKHSEFEPYRDSIRDADFQFWINNLRESKWTISHLDLDQIHIQHGEEGAGAIADGHTRADGWVFFLQNSGQRASTSGQHLPENAAFVIAPGDHFSISANDAHGWVSVFVPNSLLVDSRERLEELTTQGNESRVVLLTADQQAGVTRLVSLLGGEPSNPTPVVISNVVGVARELLVSPGHYGRRMGRRPTDHRRILDVVLQTIESTKELNPSIRDLVNATDMSERTLRSIVGTYFGISPTNFVILRRLHEARKRLREESTERTQVGDVGRSLAFTDLGRFAASYRSLFGENPNETLERSDS